MQCNAHTKTRRIPSSTTMERETSTGWLGAERVKRLYDVVVVGVVGLC